MIFSSPVSTDITDRFIDCIKLVIVFHGIKHYYESQNHVARILCSCKTTDKLKLNVCLFRLNFQFLPRHNTVLMFWLGLGTKPTRLGFRKRSWFDLKDVFLMPRSKSKNRHWTETSTAVTRTAVQCSATRGHLVTLFPDITSWLKFNTYHFVYIWLKCLYSVTSCIHSS